MTWRVAVGTHMLAKRGSAYDHLARAEVREITTRVLALLGELYRRSNDVTAERWRRSPTPDIRAEQDAWVREATDAIVAYLRPEHAVSGERAEPERMRTMVKALALILAAPPTLAGGILSSAGLRDDTGSAPDAFERSFGRPGAQAVAIAVRSGESTFGDWSPRPSVWPMLRGFRPPPSTTEPQRPDDHLHRWLAGRHGDRFSVTR